jgi:hypothetical protein
MSMQYMAGRNMQAANKGLHGYGLDYVPGEVVVEGQRRIQAAAQAREEMNTIVAQSNREEVADLFRLESNTSADEESDDSPVGPRRMYQARVDKASRETSPTIADTDEEEEFTGNEGKIHT